MKALKKVLGESFNVERVDAAYITNTEKKFRRVNKAKLEKMSSDIKEDRKQAKK